MQLIAHTYTAVTVTTRRRTFVWWVFATDDYEAIGLARFHWPHAKVAVTHHGYTSFRVYR